MEMSNPKTKTIKAVYDAATDTRDGDWISIDGCRWRVRADNDMSGAVLIVEKDGHELYRSTEDYVWLMRSVEHNLAEILGEKLFRKRV
jgi:hypothetical protein